jgi:riboflavin synthase alpha subunit
MIRGLTDGSLPFLKPAMVRVSGSIAIDGSSSSMLTLIETKQLELSLDILNHNWVNSGLSARRLRDEPAPSACCPWDG